MFLHRNFFSPTLLMFSTLLHLLFVIGTAFATLSNAGETITLVQTAETYPSKERPDRLTPYTYDILDEKKLGVLTLKIDARKKYQELQGFGGAFTESVAHVFSQLNTKLQEEVLEALWGETGQQYNMARLTIGSTDFAVGVYNYNENPGNLNQSMFSIAHDEKEIIPLIKRAEAKAPKGIQFLSTSWSPPGWMKRAWLAKKGYMRNSAKPGMIDRADIFESYAEYLSKYLSAYKAAGINVTRMTIQNEPDSADHQFPVAYPCNNFNGTGEGEFLLNYLGPKVRKEHSDVKIYVHDGQKFHDVPILTRVEEIINAAGGNFKYIDGVAFHWYGNNLANYQYLSALHEKYPDLSLLATEATLEAPAGQHIGTTPWKEAQKYVIDIIGDLNAGAEGWIEWNVLLDNTGGPTCIGPTTNDYCTPLVGHCDAPILANIKEQTLEYRDTYWLMAHFSRFIPRGSILVSATNDTATGLIFTAALNPKNDLIVVVGNMQDKQVEKYQLDFGAKKYVVIDTIPSHSIQTITLPASMVEKTLVGENTDLLRKTVMV